jgi:hypothetical protein
MIYQDRPYQAIAKRDVERRLETEREVVLAACPSSGKTKMAIDLVELLLSENPSARVLILAHATHVLKRQWADRLAEAGIEASEDFSGRVVLGIPQGLIRREGELPAFDLAIVDEAHEYVFVDGSEDGKGMVPTILRHAKKVLYLTGTPSKFIRRGIDPVIVAAEELIPEYVSGLHLGLASTNAKLTGHWRSDDNLDRSGEALLVKSVKSDLDNLLEAITARLASERPGTELAPGWDSVFARLPKSMVACVCVAQARRVEAYFKRRGVNVLGSNYMDDPDSEHFDAFQMDPMVQVLVVVDRGVLGFDMPALANVVDMTGSKSPDRVYQLYARAMRVNPEQPGQEKTFFKIVPKAQKIPFRICMQASVLMMRRDFISRYNGRNLNGMLMPVPRMPKEPREDSNEDRAEDEDGDAKTWWIDRAFAGEVMAHAVLKDACARADAHFEEYAWCSIGDIKQRLEGGNRTWTEESFIAEAMAWHRAGHAMHSRAVRIEYPSLWGTGSRLFGSWEAALAKMGIASERKSRIWTEESWIAEAVAWHRAGHAMNSRAVHREYQTLERYGRKLFGSWEAALAAAGIASERKYRVPWTEESWIAEAVARHRAGHTMHSGAVQRNYGGFHTAGRRLFGSWFVALAAAGLTS